MSRHATRRRDSACCDNLILAISACASSCCMKRGSSRAWAGTSARCRNCLTISATKSSPPRKLSPAVARTPSRPRTAPAPTRRRCRRPGRTPGIGFHPAAGAGRSQRGGGGFVDQALDLQAASSPAMRVAWRWESEKYAGTLMTASSTGAPSSASASAFSARSTSEDSSSARNRAKPERLVAAHMALEQRGGAVRMGLQAFARGLAHEQRAVFGPG